MKLIIFFVFLFVLCAADSIGQVRIRVFANQTSESAVFTVTEGSYNINFPDKKILTINSGEPVIIMKYNDMLSVKKINTDGFLCDSLIITGNSGNDSFSLRNNGKLASKQNYSGDLQCYADLGTIVFINITDREKYLSGVVMAEGGPGKNLEYFKTQAIIARTYMYRYFNKHKDDRYNLCDDTHCQAFNGLSTDTILNKAVYETKDTVILNSDNTLIISTFHSNCGGETSSSEDVWLSDQSYLKRINDPYCITSRSAVWRKSFSKSDWILYLKKSGFNENINDTLFSFLQKSRQTDYRTGTFSLPFRKMRTDLNLRSSFFSVFVEGDSVILKGRGYGHGVGLCQEGAMVMASKGFGCHDIINFYYTGVILANIKNAVDLP